MKRLLFTLLLTLLNLTLIAQNGSSIEKDNDEMSINSDDIIKALEFSGIEIHKFAIGEFNQKCKITFYIDEYKSDSLINEKVLYRGNNTRKYYDDNKELKVDYISEIRIITKEENDNCELSINLQGRTLNREFSFDKTYNRQFFKWIPYANTSYKVNHKVPMMAYISSWKDKGVIRHCGIRKLTENSVDAEKFFRKSPNYFIISYLIENE